MTDHNEQRETDSAFVTDLLNRLRRQMEGEELTDTADVSPASDAREEAVPFAEETSEASADVPDVSPDDEDETLEQADGPVPDGILPMYADGLTEENDTESPDDHAVETSVRYTPSTEASDEIVDSVVGDQYAMAFPEPLYEGEEVPYEDDLPTRTPYSRTILPENGRISESARHPVDERYRNLYETGSDAPEEEEPEQLTMQLDSLGTDMPVPDEEVVTPVAVTPPVVEAASAFEEPASVWDTPVAPSVSISEPVIPEREEEILPPPAAPVETPAASMTEEEEIPVFHATTRAKRETFSDVDFDAVRDSDVLREKVLSEPVESVGGEHSAAQMDLWQSELTRRRRSARVRSMMVGGLAILLALYELIPFLTNWLLGALLITRVPGVVALIDIQLLILACLIGYRPLYRGIAALRFKRVLPETLASFAAAVCLLGGVVFYLTGVSDGYLFALVGTVVVLAAVLADYFRQDALLHSFRAYAAPFTHFGGILTNAEEHRLIRELYADGTGPVLMETEAVSDVEGYIFSMRERLEGKYASLISLCVAAAVSLVDLTVLLILHRGIAFAFWSALITFAAVMPLSLFMVHRYLTRMLISRISDERIGVTGESAIYRYAECGLMSFSDTEAFPNGSVQVKGIKLCGDFRLDKALYLVSSLFDHVGGPLNGVFRISTADVRISDDVVIRKLAPEGIEALVNREELCVGTRAYLEGIGIEIFRDIEDERAEQDGNRVLYVAYLGTLCTKFYVRYEISAAFEKNVEYYAKNGVSSVIITADPLMDAGLLDAISYISEYDVRFVKQDLLSFETERSTPREVELISYGPRKTLRRMPFFFKKYVSLQKVASVLSMVGLGVSAVAIPLLLALVPMETALFAFLLQLIALVPTVVIGILVRRLNPNP